MTQKERADFLSGRARGTRRGDGHTLAARLWGVLGLADALGHARAHVRAHAVAPGEMARAAMRVRLLCTWVLSFAVALATIGCSPHLAGTNDAALEYEFYEVRAESVAAGEAASVAARAKARLSAARIAADVDATVDGRRVRVVVDADATEAVDALLLWRGGLTVLAQNASEAASIAQLPVASSTPAERGRAIALTFPATARETLNAEARAHPGERIVIARGNARLATLSIEEALDIPLVVSFGHDVTAYARAAHSRDLLASPLLPPMRRVAVARLPTDRPLAIACAVLPFALSLAWLAFVRRFDRARPEPLWLVLATFALGGLSVIPAGIAEMACAATTPWLDPSVMTLGGQPWALPVAIAVFSLVVGMAEEGAKFLGVWSLAAHRREFDEPVDGIVYGCAAALGFAAIENIKYFALGRMSGMVIAVRAFVTVPAHLFFGALWGYALGRRLVVRRTSVLAFFAFAAVAHGTFDALLSTEGMQLVSTGLILGLAVVFVAMLRSALRYGAISPPAIATDGVPRTEQVPAGDLNRTYFRVGSAGAFYGWAAGLVACAFAITVLGGAYEIRHHRVGIVFVSLATALLALFGVAAHRASETIPLDVAIDAHGVTLGGARTPWRAVISLQIEATGKRADVILQTAERPVLLGPTSVAVAHAIAAAIRAVHTVV